MGTTKMSNTDDMCFYDDLSLVYEEFVYPDHILFHNVNGVLAKAGSMWMAELIREGLEERDYRVEKWKPNK